MRIALAALLIATGAAPMAAQSFKFSTMAEGDTAVTLRRENGDYVCTVTVRGRELPKKEANPICDRVEETAEKARKEAEGHTREARRLSEEMVARTREWTEANKQNLEELRLRSREMAGSMSSMNRDMARAREEMARARQDMERNGILARTMPSMAGRPIIGVNIDTRPRDTDKYGAYLTGVTPGGPAAKAGLRAGDIIVRIDGKSLVGGQSEDESSLPSNRLIEVVAGLTPGRAVDLQYRRGEATRTTKVTPTEDEAMVARYDVVEPRAPMVMSFPRSTAGAPAMTNGFGEMRVLREDGKPGAFSFTIGGALADLELAPMNARLGTYFGTTEGVLVINVPEKDNLGLQPGDVVTKVDGRDVETPSEFLRVLRTYDKGDSFKLTVTRQKRTEVVAATLP